VDSSSQGIRRMSEVAMEQVVEMDSEISEDILNIVEFLKEGMPGEHANLQEGYLYNKRVFSGWMKQPSACCAAASLAGAYNALGCLQRGDVGALTHTDILQIYHSMFSDIITKHKGILTRIF
jgi:hypothetical protein